MTKQTGFQMSKKYEFIPPPEGELLLIRESGWDTMKQRVGDIKEAVNVHLTLASAFLGGFLSTVGLVLFGAVPATNPEGNWSVPYILAWALSAVLLICGLGFRSLGWRHQKIQGWQATHVIDFMNLIEQDCQRAKGTQ
jgi:hypothetical protein